MFNRKNSDEVEQGAAARASSTEPARPVAAAVRAEPVRRPSDAPAHANGQTRSVDSKKLIVGPEISLHGHISSCDRLVVEGTVEAELTDCHTVEIMRTGVFTGAAEIESAEISGRYEGSLTVRGHLLIHGTGSVSGTIRYGRLEIQPGGLVNGDIKSIDAKAKASARAEGESGSLQPMPVAAAAPSPVAIAT